MISSRIVQIYRCGWCGFPTDTTGKALALSYDRAVAYVAEAEADGAKTVKTNGSCCPNGDGSYDRSDWPDWQGT